MGLFTLLLKRNLDFPATKSTSQITTKTVLPPNHFFIVFRPSFCTEEGLFLWIILIANQFILFPLLLLRIDFNP
jgi:hypothetical protein